MQQIYKNDPKRSFLCLKTYYLLLRIRIFFCNFAAVFPYIENQYKQITIHP